MGPETTICGRMYVNGRLQYMEAGIADGKIVAVGKRVSGGDNRIKLGTSMIVLPGFMDPHVHLRDPGMTQKEDFSTGTMSALYGGVTCVLDMPNTKPPVTNMQTLMDKKRIVGGRSYVDYGLFAALAPSVPIAALAPYVPAFKLFMGSTTGNILLNDDSGIAPLMDEIARTGKVLSVHAEDDNYISHGVKENCSQDHLRDRPAEAEYSAIRRLARYKDVKINICHATNAEQVRMASEAGFTTEVAMHHLLFNASKNTDAFYKTNPPVREETSRKGLFRAFKMGRIDMFGTDHAPHTFDEKIQEYNSAPGGIPGVETAVPIVMDLVRSGTIPLDLAVRMGAENPGRIFRASKGKIAEGFDADFAIFDFRKTTEIDQNKLHSKAGWSPYHGMRAIFPDTVIIRGQVQIQEGELCGECLGKDICG